MNAVSPPRPSTAVHRREPGGPAATTTRAAVTTAARTVHRPDSRPASRERRTDHRVMSAWRTVSPSSGNPRTPSGLAALPQVPPSPRAHRAVPARTAAPTDRAAAASMEEVET